jgi:hypothetical protein
MTRSSRKRKELLADWAGDAGGMEVPGLKQQRSITSIAAEKKPESGVEGATIMTGGPSCEY